MNYRRILITTIFLLCFIFCNSSCSSSSGDNIAVGRVTDYRSSRSQPLEKNQPAPDFQFQMPDGTIIFLSDLQGDGVLLNFWAVNCKYCAIEMPYLQEAYEQLATKGVIILGINTGESERTVASFIGDKKLTFPILLDTDIYASMLYGAQFLPTTYFIDKNGNIQGAKIGAFKDTNEIITIIEALLQ